MGKRTLDEVEQLAARILQTYFCESDMEFMIFTFADDIIWLGGGEKQKAVICMKESADCVARLKPRPAWMCSRE